MNELAEVRNVHRRDAEATRRRILQVARAEFGRHGYDGATVRGIAAAAGVAPNLITRYFGSKAALFRAASDIHLDVPAALSGPYASLGARIADRVVRRWESAGVDDPLQMMMRSAGTSDEMAAEMSSFFTENASAPLAAHVMAALGCSAAEADDRAVGVGALIMGVVMARYIMRSGPLAGSDPDALRVWLGAVLQRLLDEPSLPPLLGTGLG